MNESAATPKTKAHKQVVGSMTQIFTRMSHRVFITVLTLLCAASFASASQTGKIAGVVLDSANGDPIVGARIEVVGTEYGGITDADGEYYILDVPAGAYQIRVIAPGFEWVTKEGARVLLDLTTPIDFTLGQRETEISEPITVVATRPLVQKDQTASRFTVTSEQIGRLPNAITLADVLANMSGAVVDRDGNIHIRGGRTGQVNYIYDGVTVTDPLFRNLGIRIVPDALEELNLTSGGMPAEYGEAGSAVVNAVTREGGKHFSGSIAIYDGLTQPYDRFSGDLGKLTRSENQIMRANFSGPIVFAKPLHANFFAAVEGLRDAGYLPHNFVESRHFTGRVTARPVAALKLSISGSYYQADGEYYDHSDVNGFSYDFNLDGLGLTRNRAEFLSVRGAYALSPSSILDLGVGHFQTSYKLAPTHLFDTHWSQWPGFVADSNGQYDPSNGTIHVDNYNLAAEYGYTGYTFGDDFDPRWKHQRSRYNSFTGSLVSQVNNRNEVKLGGEYRKYNIFWDEKQFLNPVPYGETYTYAPVYGHVFAQDKLEYQDVIINAGLRFDYLSSQVRYLVDPLDTVQVWKTSTPKSQLSPRLGVSHPVAENTILRFNYGYFFQAPKFWTMYSNLDGEINSGYPRLGNPDLKPEKTISYEIGFDHTLSDDIVVGMTAYHKDVENLVATRALPQGPVGLAVTTFVNEDYSSIKGFDLHLAKRKSGILSGEINYSLMKATGNSPSETFAYYNYIGQEDTTLPTKAYALDFDQRHTMTVNMDITTPRDWHGRFLVLPLSGAWGLNVIGRYGSGLPFTKVNSKTGSRIGGLNDYRMPTTYQFDARVSHDFPFGRGATLLRLFVEVENVFNRKNIVNVYPGTGLPDDDGVDFAGGGPYVTPEESVRLHSLIVKDPGNFGPPRVVRTGLQFRF